MLSGVTLCDICLPIDECSALSLVPVLQRRQSSHWAKHENSDPSNIPSWRDVHGPSFIDRTPSL